MPLTFTWGEITLTTLATAIITTYVNHIIYKKQKALDFKQEYRKAMLEHRIKAYQEVESVINKLKEIDLVKGGKEIIGIYVNCKPGEPNEFHNTLIRIYNLWDYAIWINDEMLSKIKKVYTDLLYDYARMRVKPKRKFAIKLGLDRTLQIKAATKELRIMLINELLNLHDIDTSLISKKESNERYPP